MFRKSKVSLIVTLSILFIISVSLVLYKDTTKNEIAKVGIGDIPTNEKVSLENELSKDNNESKPVNKEIGLEASIEKSLSDETEKVEVPPNTEIIQVVDKDNIIMVSHDRKRIQKYNIKTGEAIKITDVFNADSFMKSVEVSGKWYLWAEDEAFVTDYNNKPFKWSLVAYNYETKEKVVMDKSNFNRNNYEVPQFITYTPYRYAISTTNKVVYCKNLDLNNTVGSQVLLYDLEKKEKSIINESKDVNKELLTDCNIYEDNLVYCKFDQLNDDYSFRPTQYKFSDLYEYNINDKKTTQLTDKDFYCEPSMYKDKLAVIKMPAKASILTCYAELGIFDIKAKEYKSLVNRSTHKAIYDHIYEDIYSSAPNFTNNLLAWRDSAAEVRYIYDIDKNIFKEVIREKIGYQILIHGIFQNHLTFVEVNKSTGEPKLYIMPFKN